jgi:ABC-type multidrug transport system fused ATPase/permease subunit
MLVIAHRLSTVRGASHVLVFRGGRIVEEGSWEDLLAREGEFTRLHRAQFEGVMAGR